MADEVVSFLKYTPKSGMQVCPYCEVENSLDRRFCFVCDADLSKPPAPEERDETIWRDGTIWVEPGEDFSQEPTKNPIVRFLLISIIIVLCTLLVFIISQS